MDALTFRNMVIEGLEKLTDEDIDKMRSEMDLQHEYEIDDEGRTYIIEKNVETIPEDNIKKVMSDIDSLVPKISSDRNDKSNFTSEVRKSKNSEFQTASKGEMKVYVQDEYFKDIVNRTGDKTKAIRKAA
ncbi:hypothetical protein [Lactobacillus apis]|uniref:hypothetical protein n=1 Tax=Lactobacillus apis TaxID=303541 RepID=UPI0024324B92|nr:hypothetical protein [Lactobacillus apis]